MPEHGPVESPQAEVLRRELDPKQRRAFSVARRTAQRVLQRRVRLFKLLQRGYHKVSGQPEVLKDLTGEFTTLLRLVRTWARREYREVPWRSLLYAVGAIVYFVNPVDLIPDALAMIGFVDDIAVVGAVVKAIQNDLDAFRRWEQKQLAG